MQLRVLRYFLAVAKTKNITAAAKMLNISQPALSKQLMDLEEEIGKKLLVRGKRKTTLTKEGEFIRRRAQMIVDLADETKTAFKAPDRPVSGDVFIGCGETPGIRQLTKIMEEINARFADIRFHFYCGNVDDVSEKLDSDQLDFALFVGSTDIIGKYNYINLPESDRWGLLMRDDNPLAARGGVRPGDMREQKIICSKQALASNDLSDWLGSDFTGLNIVSRHNLVYSATLMVERGFGCALTKEGLVNTEGTNMVFRPLEPTLKADLRLAWKKHQILSKSAQEFLSRAKNLVSPPAQ